MDRTVKIPNMSCNHCVQTIESELKDIDGVVSATADLDTKSVRINWSPPANWERIQALLEEINFPPEK
jgi:copper chaperone CopZ